MNMGQEESRGRAGKTNTAVSLCSLKTGMQISRTTCGRHLRRPPELKAYPDFKKSDTLDHG